MTKNGEQRGRRKAKFADDVTGEDRISTKCKSCLCRIVITKRTRVLLCKECKKREIERRKAKKAEKDIHYQATLPDSYDVNRNRMRFLQENQRIIDMCEYHGYALPQCLREGGSLCESEMTSVHSNVVKVNTDLFSSPEEIVEYILFTRGQLPEAPGLTPALLAAAMEYEESDEDDKSSDEVLVPWELELSITPTEETFSASSTKPIEVVDADKEEQSQCDSILVNEPSMSISIELMVHEGIPLSKASISEGIPISETTIRIEPQENPKTRAEFPYYVGDNELMKKSYLASLLTNNLLMSNNNHFDAPKPFSQVELDHHIDPATITTLY